MKDCCEDCISIAEPQNGLVNKVGTFFEIHKCPACKLKIKIHFEVNIVDDAIDIVVLYGEPFSKA